MLFQCNQPSLLRYSERPSNPTCEHHVGRCETVPKHRFAVFSLDSPRLIDHKMFLARPCPLSGVTPGADGGEVGNVMRPALCKRFYVVYRCCQFVEQWSLIPPPLRIPVGER